MRAFGRRAEVVRKVRERAHDRVGREAAECAERAEFHGVAEVLDYGEVLGTMLAGDDALDGLHAACRADAAGRALAAGFERAELECEAGLLGHVDGVIEDDDTAMADEAIALGEGFIVERRIEQRAREIGAEWTADLHRFDWPAGGGAAANVVDELAKRDAEGGLEQPAVLDVA